MNYRPIHFGILSKASELYPNLIFNKDIQILSVFISTTNTKKVKLFQAIINSQHS